MYAIGSEHGLNSAPGEDISVPQSMETVHITLYENSEY